MTRYRWLAAGAALALAMACNKEPALDTLSGVDAEVAMARSKDAKDSLIRAKDEQLREKERQLTLQTQLIGDAATSARLVSEIANDLSRARVEVKPDTMAPESAIQNASDELRLVQKKVKVVVDRLNASEARIRRMRNDSVSTARLSAQQVATIAEYEKSIADLRATVESQTMEIAMLTSRVDSMGRENVVLAEQNAAVTAENDALEAQQDSVFVAIGTEQELAEKGIIHREGGRWFTFGLGKTIVPTRTFSDSDFQVLSRSQDVTIQLPDPDKEYQIVSRQSLEYTDSMDPSTPRVKGELHVTDPGKFWAPSKYLILVRR